MLNTLLIIAKVIAAIFGVITAGAVAFAAVVRVPEAINQLRQTQGLDTFQKCVQVVKNFFTIEKYK